MGSDSFGTGVPSVAQLDADAVLARALQPA